MTTKANTIDTIEKVAVLYGGFSKEREVSLNSGQKVYTALMRKGYHPILYDVPKDMRLLIDFLAAHQDSVIFNALHGTFGEDGTLQGICDTMGIHYTHSGMLASAIGMNKIVSKRLCEAAGIPVAKDAVIKVAMLESMRAIPMPYVIKPIAEGSSVGVVIVRKDKDKEQVYEQYTKECNVMVERYIEGREFTVAVLDGVPLACTEIIPKTAFYDFKEKYSADGAVHQIPAQIPKEMEEKILEYSKSAYNIIGCKGIARIDLRGDAQGIFFLEINTQPGMTDTSLAPEQAYHRGIAYDDLCVGLVKLAVRKTPAWHIK